MTPHAHKELDASEGGAHDTVSSMSVIDPSVRMSKHMYLQPMLRALAASSVVLMTGAKLVGPLSLQLRRSA
jgi:hypothetical protein